MQGSSSSGLSAICRSQITSVQWSYICITCPFHRYSGRDEAFPGEEEDQTRPEHLFPPITTPFGEYCKWNFAFPLRRETILP